MRVTVFAKPRAGSERVEKMDATHYKISVKEPATEGKANRAVAAALAKHLGVAKSCVVLVSGSTWYEKVFDVDM